MISVDKNRNQKNELLFAYNTKGRANKEGEFPRGQFKLGRFIIKMITDLKTLSNFG